MRVDEIPAFATWLVVHRAELRKLEQTDHLRFSHVGEVGFLEKNCATGEPIASLFAQAYVKAFKHKLPIPNGPQRRQSDPRTAMEIAYARDGDDCFFCGKPLAGDVTREHLLPRADDGKRQAANIVLAHLACNRLAGRTSIAEKVNLRDRLRGHTPILLRQPWPLTKMRAD